MSNTYRKKFLVIRTMINHVLSFHVSTGSDDIWIPCQTEERFETVLLEFLKVNHSVKRIENIILKRQFGCCADFEIVCEVISPENAVFKCIEDIKDAVKRKMIVHWHDKHHYVMKDYEGNYLILSDRDGYAINMMNSDGLLNDDISKFFIS